MNLGNGLYKQNSGSTAPSVINKKLPSTGLYQVIHIKQYRRDPKAPLNLEHYLPQASRKMNLSIFTFILIGAVLATVNAKSSRLSRSSIF